MDLPNASWRAVLAGEDTGRIKNELITAEATATVLVWRTQQAVNHPVDLDGFTNRVEEFHAMFALVRHIDAWTFAIEYTKLLDRLAATRRSPRGQTTA
jgi:hypothetical protein